MNSRGQYGAVRSTLGPRGRGIVAGIGAAPSDPLKDDVASFQADVAALDDDVRSLGQVLQDQIASRAATDPQLRQSPLYAFYGGHWRPFHDNWLRFRQSASSISKAGFALWNALAQLQSYRSKLSDMRVDADLAGFAVRGGSSTAAPVLVTSPTSASVEPPLVVVPVGSPPASSNTGVYLAVGVGVVAAIAAAAIYHAGAA